MGRKGKNPIYNILPDTISRLSHDSDVDGEIFRYIMKYMFGFIERKKQHEQLLDKLLKRLRACPEQSGWGDISFCIAQLNFDEKTAKSITEDINMKSYVNKLGDDAVWENFTQVIKNAKRSIKPEHKEQFDAWENKINELRTAKKSDADAASRAGKRGPVTSLGNPTDGVTEGAVTNK